MLCLGANLARNLIWSEVSREFELAVNIQVLLEAFTRCEALQHEVQHLLATEGVVVRRDHPKLISAIDWLVRNGSLRPVLPGVYAKPRDCESTATRVRALMRWDPDAVLIGSAAAQVSFWPEIRVSCIECSLKHQRRPQPGYQFTRQQIPAELVVSHSGIRYTSPALTALDLCATVGGDAIDQALRTRATTLRRLHQAMELTASRVGNRTRRQLLLDSRDEPWSKAERSFHRLLRKAGITGWRANQPVILNGSTFYVDVMFRRLRLVIEIDGRLYHTGAEVFETDRWRQNILILDGWCVLRFTWTMIEEHPEEVIAMVREAIEMLTARRS
jgi:very-short-patch-repair endonuclease